LSPSPSPPVPRRRNDMAPPPVVPVMYWFQSSPMLRHRSDCCGGLGDPAGKVSTLSDAPASERLAPNTRPRIHASFNPLRLWRTGATSGSTNISRLIFAFQSAPALESRSDAKKSRYRHRTQGFNPFRCSGIGATWALQGVQAEHVSILSDAPASERLIPIYILSNSSKFQPSPVLRHRSHWPHHPVRVDLVVSIHSGSEQPEQHFQQQTRLK